MVSITSKDVVSVRGQHLYKADGTRFFMKGIAFPIPPSPSSRHDGDDDAASSIENQYNATAWIAILHQLSRSLELDYNTIRVYAMDPAIDYSAFFDEAAKLGVYVLVPLTSSSGDGVLDRTLKAPKCYSRRLLKYGVACLQNYLQYPNTLAGLLANEVMDSLESWKAAPCIKAYARDLKLYMKEQQQQQQEQQSASFNGNARPPSARQLLPLMYAAQHSGMGAAVNVVDAMRLTVNYLTCSHRRQQQQQRSSSTTPSSSSSTTTTSSSVEKKKKGLAVSWSSTTKGDDDDDVDGSTIDIFGVNVESWCSSLNTFERNEDGSVGTYYTLWQGLHNVSVPLVFTEMGCSHKEFNKDSPSLTSGEKEGTRDWRQVGIVLNDMADTWSGFSAYAYYGNPMFNMFRGGPWNGRDPLVPTDDFFNFRNQLEQVKAGGETFMNDTTDGNSSALHASHHHGEYNKLKPWPLPLCVDVAAQLRACCDIELYDDTRMPSYMRTPNRSSTFYCVAAAVFVGVVCIVWLFFKRRRRMSRYQSID